MLLGLRSGSLPVVLAGGEEHLVFDLIPISCSTIWLPTFKLLDLWKENKKWESGEGNEVEKLLLSLMPDLRNENGPIEMLQNYILLILRVYKR